MANEWLEYAKSRLDPDDEVQKNFIARYNGNYGYIVMSQRKVLFIGEKGFIRHTHDLLLELPYETVEDTSIEAPNTLIIESEGGKRHVFTTDFAPATTIETNLKELIEDNLPRIS